MAVDQVTAEILQSALSDGDSGSGDVPPLPTLPGDGTYSQDQLGDNPYTQYAIDTVYHRVTGLDVLATGNIDGTVIQGTVIRSHQGIMMKTVTFEMEREGLVPDIPSSDTKNPNEILIDEVVKFANPLLTGTGKYVFHAGGKYVYKLLIWLDQTKNKFPMSTTPAETLGPEDAFHYVDKASFKDKIISTDYTTGDPQLQIPIQGPT